MTIMSKNIHKYILAALFAAVSINMSFAQYVPRIENLKAREEFQNMRFGIFIHWGIYSMFGQGEWFMNNNNVDFNEYSKAASAFYPQAFNAKEWVDAIKDSGAKYICFTSRHHDSFSMFKTAQSPYNIVDATPYGEDVLKKLADECHEQDITLNLYYSLLDWTRQDYPIGQTGKGTGRVKGLSDMNTYMKFMKGQLKELLTNYGKIGAIWFDGWWDHEKDSIPFDWHLDELYSLIHNTQPTCLVANNHHVTPFDGEDIQNFERDIPGENKAGLSGQSVGQLPLETCQTMNESWGYNCTDNKYKSVGELIQLIVRAAGKNANLLLNVGPQPNGKIPDQAIERLKGIGKWMRQYGETIYGTTAGEPGELEWGTTTQKDNTLYLHVLKASSNNITVPLKSKVRKVCTFDGKVPLKYTRTANGISVDLINKPDAADFIIEVNLK